MTVFSELIKTRYSVRTFKALPVEDAILTQVLEAGRLAPTACNNQPQRIKIITSPEDLTKIDACTPCRFGAPAVLLVCYDKSICWRSPFDGMLSGVVDASIVTTHIMLAAHEVGLGACWVMYFDQVQVTALFGLGENIVPVAMLPLGYPAESAAPNESRRQRQALDKLLI